jgi:hypothetical protein
MSLLKKERKMQIWGFNMTHATSAIGEYWERVTSQLLGATRRNAQAWPDLVIRWENTECEVKMRYYSQPVEISMKQAGAMQENLELWIQQYYALNFYRTTTGQRIWDILKTWNDWVEYDIKSKQAQIKRKIEIETIFLFPLPVIFDFFNKRDTKWVTRKYRDSKNREPMWSSNIWPIKNHFEGHDWTKLILTTQWFSKKRPNMSVYIIGDEMRERVLEVHKGKDFILPKN